MGATFGAAGSIYVVESEWGKWNRNFFGAPSVSYDIVSQALTPVKYTRVQRQFRLSLVKVLL